jgi:glutamate racemase
LLRDVISELAAASVALVDSASTTAGVVQATLEERALQCTRKGPGTLRLLATDSATRFARVGGQFLGRDLSYKDIEIVDL